MVLELTRNGPVANSRGYGSRTGTVKFWCSRTRTGTKITSGYWNNTTGIIKGS